MSENTENKPAKSKGGIIKIIIVILIIAAAFAAAHFTGLLDRLELSAENLTEMRDMIQGWGAIGYVAFILIYVLAAVFFLPALIFAILAGVAFGPVIGGLMALCGATVGAMAAFIVARYVARKTIVDKFGDSPMFKKIDDGIKKNGVSFLILTRLVPVFPYNVQNYIYGLTPIKFTTYSVVSLITMAPGAFIYAYMAGTIFDTLAAGEQPNFLMLILQFAAAGVVLFLISLIPKYIAKKKGIKIKDD